MLNFKVCGREDSKVINFYKYSAETNTFGQPNGNLTIIYIYMDNVQDALRKDVKIFWNYIHDQMIYFIINIYLNYILFQQPLKWKGNINNDIFIFK